MSQTPSMLAGLQSPILLAGDDRTAYRDPAVVVAGGVFHLLYTLVETEQPGDWPYLYTAVSTSRDLRRWTTPRKLTVRDRSLNFSSPGNVVRFGDEWVMCLQTYPRRQGQKYGSPESRVWTMRSRDLINWDPPALLRVHGPEVSQENMGRMIDPYLVEDASQAGRWWCFFKQNGISRSYSTDLTHWTFDGAADGGENVCIVRDGDEYVLLHSPENGIGVRRSRDLRHWHDTDLLHLGQAEWPWARGRITAGFVLDARGIAGVERFLLFFHGSGPEDEQVIFDTHACIGLAWSRNLKQWDWPGK